MQASNHVLHKKHGYFDLLGCDFMLSATNKLSMLEINTNPSLTLGECTIVSGVVDTAVFAAVVVLVIIL